MKISLKYIKAGLLVLFLFGCSKDILEENPPNLLSGETLYTNLAGFEAGLNGLYNLARHGRWQSEKIEYALNGVDNMTSNYKRSNIYYAWKATNSPADDDLLEVFAWYYETINAANTIITRAENKEVDWVGGSGTPEVNKNRVIAEAKAIRGWAYRGLTYGWGDVPLSLTEYTGSTIRSDWERAPVADVRKQIISDYKFAQQHIPTEGSLPGRITKGAVQTFMAEMYLTLNKPDSALYWADQVITNPAYKLVTQRYGVQKSNPLGSPYGDMFKEGNQNRNQGNTEALWVFQFNLNSIDEQGNEMSRAVTGNYNLWVINGKRPLQYTYERGGRGKSYFAVTKWFVDSFEPQDDRAANYILRKYFILNNAAANAPYAADILPSGYSYGDTLWTNWSKPISATHNSLPDWPYSRKGEGSDPQNLAADFSWHDLIYLRLADTYLLKAEAQFKMGNAAAAATTLNIIRQRSKAKPITGADVTIDFILDERSRELITEEDRRYTLLRTNKWLERTKKYNFFGGEMVAERDVLFPIPQDVIDSNLAKKMTQNPGWN
ncbi:membrane protein [Adhaeribacter aerolatus]|uniref:Membrane protein n=1 Tax=Adhaeribacter aerolatus TaxID=670289 RepID=A0A512AVH8_9BACT|nr:RagB/SusD family nutrient uptake outer membrane protein [Adhaeribacter aerolatus]GEO03726.1 membrane protein [Adhaeribacter aerolatus]